MESLRKLSLKQLELLFKQYPLYSQDDIKKKKVILEIFVPNQNIYWLILEGQYDQDDFIFFGYCHIVESEYGYVSFKELSSLGYNLKYVYHKNPISLNSLKNKYNI